MKLIAAADYYAQFQTALYIAVEELGVKQAALAEVCGISPGYLSKLRGWNRDSESKQLTRRPHMTNTNFKSYAVPLLELLRNHAAAVQFDNGIFTQKGSGAEKQWGELALLEPQLPEKTPGAESIAFPEILPQLDGIEFPPEGELNIQWAFDFERDPAARKKALVLLQQLAEHANSQVVIQVKLKTPAPAAPVEPPEEKAFRKAVHFKSPPPVFGSVNQASPAAPTPAVRHLPALIRNTPFFHLDVDVAHTEATFPSRVFEHISVLDSKNDRLTEQFCDLSQWNVLSKQGEFSFDFERKQFTGGGLYHYLLSQFEYGRQPYIIHAELAFRQYADHNNRPSEKANAGFILGWHYPRRQPTYYHLLLTGEKMLLERIGAHAGDAYHDFEHLDAGVDFRIEDGQGYNFLLRVDRQSLDVVVDHQHVYHVALPEGIVGQVGLRPWRAEVACRFFEVRELAGR